MEFYGQHTIESGENAVTKIVALPNEVSVARYFYTYFCTFYTRRLLARR